MGYVNDPSKAVYNKIYNKTTRSLIAPSSSPSDLSIFTVEELKDMLRARGLKVSGRKQELIDRLQASEDTWNTESNYYNIESNTSDYVSDIKMICPQCESVFINHSECLQCHCQLELYDIYSLQKSTDAQSTGTGIITAFIIALQASPVAMIAFLLWALKWYVLFTIAISIYIFIIVFAYKAGKS